MSRAPLRVAVLGAGTVGREVVRALLDHPERLCAADGAPLVLAGVACRDLERARRSGIPAELLTDAPAHLVADPETDVIVELMGGDEPARTLIAAALSAGKPVVTANKHVIAHHGSALEAVARRGDVALRFEAAVAGGIPVLGVLAADLAANEIRRVRGIVNGTTNFILSAMGDGGRGYADVLADAQARGYAEADPTGDVEGDDAVNKLVILARLAFGRWLEPSAVSRRPPAVLGIGAPGITGVTDQVVAAAARLGLTIKLLATARRLDDELLAGVIPTAVRSGSQFGQTGGVLNRVEIDAEPLGAISLSGPGAGGAATSSAVLGDLVAVGRGLASTWAGRPPTPTADPVEAALEPTVEGRDWFAFIPGAHDDGRDDASGGAGQVLPTDHGLAIRLPATTLDNARAIVGGRLPAGTDATLYPVES
jgi:homoserine dehydrogenase